MTYVSRRPGPRPTTASTAPIVHLFSCHAESCGRKKPDDELLLVVFDLPGTTRPRRRRFCDALCLLSWLEAELSAPTLLTEDRWRDCTAV